MQPIHTLIFFFFFFRLGGASYKIRSARKPARGPLRFLVPGGLIDRATLVRIEDRPTRPVEASF